MIPLNEIVTEHSNAESLDAQGRNILQTARESLQLAYAPYSGFLVGAALYTEQGQIFKGANQENASYPLCMCGERVALYVKAILAPDEPIDTLAIRVSSANGVDTPAPPCGACLQVINEFEMRQGRPIRILLQGDSEIIYEVSSVRKLMPLHFDGSFLK